MEKAVSRGRSAPTKVSIDIPVPLIEIKEDDSVKESAVKNEEGPLHIGPANVVQKEESPSVVDMAVVTEVPHEHEEAQGDPFDLPLPQLQSRWTWMSRTK